jgi:hypothetical protein
VERVREIDATGLRKTHASFSVLGLLLANDGTASRRSSLVPDDLHVLLGGSLLNVGFLR